MLGRVVYSIQNVNKPGISEFLMMRRGTLVFDDKSQVGIRTKAK
jgi:hypothetical protein